jgi:VanZ family protein
VVLSRVVVARVAVVVWVAVVTWTSLIPLDGVPGAASVSDTLLHAIAYAVLGALLALAMQRPRPVLAWVAIVVFGLVIELLQARTGYRSFEWRDLAADAAGGALGISLVILVSGLRSRREAS